MLDGVRLDGEVEVMFSYTKKWEPFNNDLGTRLYYNLYVSRRNGYAVVNVNFPLSQADTILQYLAHDCKQSESSSYQA